MKRAGLLLGLTTLAFVAAGPALAQQPSTGPAVGIVPAARQSVTQSSEYIGRVQATNRVNIVPRVAAFLDQVLFTEGAEIRKDDLLYRLEQAPFRADIQAKEASVAEFKARLQNARTVLHRAQALLRTAAGQQAAVDIALANEQALLAQVLGAEALLAQSRINLAYTEIRAPIAGKIGRTAVTAGNYVSPATGTLVSIVSQDPMYVVFQVSTRTVADLQQKASQKSAAVIRLRLPDGRIYDHAGKLDFIDNTVAGNTDTITLRGVVTNARVAGAENGLRQLVDGQLVNVILEDATPTEAITVPRAAVLTDARGDYVFVVGADSKAEQRRVKLGQSTPAFASIVEGLVEGENVVVDGIQRVRAGSLVSAGPAQARPGPPGAAPAVTAPAGAAPAPAASGQSGAKPLAPPASR
jgi:membrane fusion protein (multidrug efflux system)